MYSLQGKSRCGVGGRRSHPCPYFGALRTVPQLRASVRFGLDVKTVDPTFK